MLSPEAAALLQRILDETRAGRLRRRKDDEDYFLADVGTNVQPISIRPMWIECTNQVGADPYFVEVRMAGWNTRFAIVDDSDGWQCVRFSKLRSQADGVAMRNMPWKSLISSSIQIQKRTVIKEFETRPARLPIDASSSTNADAT